MSDPELPGAEYWRSRAEEIRTKAELMHDPVAAQHRPCEPTDGLAPAERLPGSLALLLTDCDLLRRMKFDPVGYHPIEGQPLNFVEQINQTCPLRLPWAPLGSCSLFILMSVAFAWLQATKNTFQRRLSAAACAPCAALAQKSGFSAFGTSDSLWL
jgi:hypothetical protein